MKHSWSFPTSPRNPGKIALELQILARLVEDWKRRGMPWSPQTTQLELGQALRGMGEDNELAFQHQAETISESNTKWTARARWGSYKFLGLVYIDVNGYAELTNAGKQMMISPRPGRILLKQLIKWQYLDPQHNKKEYPPTIFQIHPFLVVTRLIRDLKGLSKSEMAICFLMTKENQIADTRKQILKFRNERSAVKGRVPKKKYSAKWKDEIKTKAEKMGIKISANSFPDYADALGRYLRYTGLFSLKGDRLIIARGREEEIDEILSQIISIQPCSNEQLFYAYYGDPTLPVLPSDTDMANVRLQIEAMEQTIRDLTIELSEAGYSSSTTVIRSTYPGDIDGLLSYLDQLRDTKKNFEMEILSRRQFTPVQVIEIIQFYDEILGHRTFDDPTFLEWNTWRLFVALDRSSRIHPNLILDENLDPVNVAPGNRPDLEISFDGFHIMPEVTLQKGANQAYCETWPVARHMENFLTKVNGEPSYGLFVAPKCHIDTMLQFYNFGKHGGSSGRRLPIIPFTLDQFREITQHCSQHWEQYPNNLRDLLERVEVSLEKSQNSDEWGRSIPTIIQDWKSVRQN